MAGVDPVEPPKTNSAAPVADSSLTLAPFIFNGRVFSADEDGETSDGDLFEDEDEGQGSGVIAGNAKTIFSSAHLLYDRENLWTVPPAWAGPQDAELQMPRGYFRWSAYSTAAANEFEGQNSTSAFAKDIALIWGLEPFIEGAPATLNFNGHKKLKAKKDLSMLTGYPRFLDYTGEFGLGKLHATAPEFTSFVQDASTFLHATHLSTGPGSPGGPMWIQDPGGDWSVAGIQVYTRPSEAGVYAFSSAIKPLIKAAAPLVGDVRKSINNNTRGVETSVGRYVLNKPKKIPDGLHKWTKIPFKVQRFEEETKISHITVDLTVTTNHRGDLMVGLLSPSGHFVLLHDGEGAGDDDLVLDNFPPPYDEDVIEEVAMVPNGTWTILVQDRLTTDQCVVTRLELEIGVVKGSASSGEEP